MPDTADLLVELTDALTRFRELAIVVGFANDRKESDGPATKVSTWLG